MKKIISFVLCVAMLCAMLPGIVASADYTEWKQGDPKWGTKTIGTSGKYMKDKGCLITSLAIMAVKLGCVTDDENVFNPGTYLDDLNLNAGTVFSGAAMKSWSAARKIASPNFVSVEDKSFNGQSFSSCVDYIKGQLDKGYGLILRIEHPGEHYVVADYVSNNVLYVIDPGYSHDGNIKHIPNFKRITHAYSYANNGENVNSGKNSEYDNVKRINETFRVTKMGTPVRDAANSKTSNIIRRLDAGTKIQVIRSMTNSYGNLWYELADGGYVYDANVEPAPDESTLSINLTRYPESIKAGTSFALSGKITSNYNISEVDGSIVDYYGSVLQSTRDYPNSKSFNVNGGNLNYKLLFGQLPSGTYTLKVEAFDESGQKVTVAKTFGVYVTIQLQNPDSGNTGNSGDSGNGPSTTGVIKVPAGWGDLNIRSGPGTGYEKLGAIPDGASCTVYTDKTKNGWYYVEYNGIYGYASGSQIVLGSSGGGSNTRTGVINVPAGWGDLNIRSGPGTGYEKLGAIPDGASCTVYPDKAKNGWYYVEYNGIYGYASGSQIDLR